LQVGRRVLGELHRLGIPATSGSTPPLCT
jgi:hypothetical protein